MNATTATAQPSVNDGNYSRYAHRVEFVDTYLTGERTEAPVHVPNRFLIDGVDVTAAVGHMPYSQHKAWSVENQDGALVVGLCLLPNCARVTPDVYGPGTYRVEITHPNFDPIELTGPARPGGSPVETVRNDWDRVTQNGQPIELDRTWVWLWASDVRFVAPNDLLPRPAVPA